MVCYLATFVFDDASFSIRMCVCVLVCPSTNNSVSLPWLLLILHDLHYPTLCSLYTHTHTCTFSNHIPGSEISQLICVCVRACICYVLQAHIYTNLMLDPPVKMQRGRTEPPHWLLRKGPQETHTLTSTAYRHNGSSEILQETAQGNSCQARVDYFPPYFLLFYFSPSFIASAHTPCPLCICSSCALS